MCTQCVGQGGELECISPIGMACDACLEHRRPCFKFGAYSYALMIKSRASKHSILFGLDAIPLPPGAQLDGSETSRWIGEAHHKLPSDGSIVLLQSSRGDLD